MPRPSIIGASLILLDVAAAAGCLGKKHADAPGEETQSERAITPEQARTALLKLGSLRVLRREDDPVAVDLSSWFGSACPLALGLLTGFRHHQVASPIFAMS
jgi:hypothetical protein